MTGRLDIPGFRPFHAHVASREKISESFVRIVFASPEFSRLGTDGCDQRIKILFPLPGGRWGDPHLFDPESVAQGMWYQQWKALDNDDRNPVRTYTIRKADPENGEMTVEFVSHSNPGPAGTFAQQCRIGDEVVIIGPDASSRHSDLGIDFRPGPSRHLLLMGDETAVPAISSILEHLHDSAWQGSGLALTEVPRKSDFRTLRMPSHFRMYQTATDGHKGASLLERLKTLAASGAAGFTPDRDQTGERIADVEDLSDADFLWEVPPQGPDDGLYAWVAGEASMVRSLRRFLVGDLGLDRHRIAFMGYYREGKREI